MGKYRTFLIFAALALQFQNVLSEPRCKQPKGTIGTHRIVGCNKLTCVRSGRRAVWQESFSYVTCCSYQRKGYQIGATITTINNGCTNVSLVCTQTDGGADIELEVESVCPKPATEESMAKQFGMVKSILAEILNNTDECCNSPTPSTPPTPPTPDEYELVFLGPSKVLNVPELTPSACIPPPHPIPSLRNPERTVWKEGTLQCGGYDPDGHNRLGTCYWLKMNTSDLGSWFSFPPMNLVRNGGAAAMLGNDWWFTGGAGFWPGPNDGRQTSTSLLFPNDTWAPGVDLPEPISAHCLLTINSTHVFMCGGLTNNGNNDATGATYIYTLGGTFAVQSSMAIARYDHGCALYNDAIWVAGGNGRRGGTTSVEFFSLRFSNWTTGQSLPVPTSSGRLLTNGGKLLHIGENNVNLPIMSIYQLERTAWVDVGTLNQSMRSFSALKWKNCTHN